MRPVESNWYRDFMYNLTNTKNQYDRDISQTTSHKKLNHLSDNPSDMAYVLTLRSKIGEIEQYDKNIQTGLGFVNTASSSLDSVKTMLYSVISIAEQGASETVNNDARDILADRIDELRDELMNYANSEVQGKFLFSGSATSTQPYTKAADTVDPVTGVTIPGNITYNGNSEYINVQADFSVTVATNIPGNEVFGVTANSPTDVFARLQTLVTSLRNNDTTGIGNEISNMHETINQIGEAQGQLGNRQAHLTQIQGMLKTFKSALVDKKSSLEDANAAEAISNLSRDETSLQAIFQSGARIQKYSLMNYLG